MALDRYTLQHKSVDNLLNLIDTNDIAIPEIQRPFVWKSTKVRDLMDSLYRGYPVGYIITWQNPDVRLKDGSKSGGKTILIDGQQRVTALKAALDGREVVNNSYEDVRITIAFHPLTERFETVTPAIRRNKEWIDDISTVMQRDFDTYTFIEQYAAENPGVDRSLLSQRLNSLLQIKTRTIGELKISSDIGIETVNEIFIRINSKGTPLSEADFAMSRIAVFEMNKGDEYGMILRKYFDYFCNLLEAPQVVNKIEQNDTTFAATEQFKNIKWVAKTPDLLYKPSYSDIIRVAGITGLGRARLRDVVSLLAGRNFEVKSFNREDSYLREIAEKSFVDFQSAVDAIVNEYNYKRFDQDILRGSGFDDGSMFGSANALNFTFAIFQKLLNLTDDYGLVRKLTRKFLVFSILTEHHGGSFETRWDSDFKRFNSIENVQQLMASYDEEQLGDVYWNVTLPRELDKVANSRTPEWNIYIAAQNKLGKQSFLSDVETRHMKVDDLHHIFPQEYMKSNGNDQRVYNRIANFVILSRDINIKIGKTAPSDYLTHITDYGSNVADRLPQNLADNCIPTDPELWKLENYDAFMKERNKLISRLIREYYESL